MTQLVERFGTARDTWIAADLNSWLAPNRIYSGVADVLRNLKQREDVYIVTTKQVNPTPFPSRVESLPLGIPCGIPLPSGFVSHLFCIHLPPEVYKQLVHG